MADTAHFGLGTMILDTLLFADDQVIFTKSKDKLQTATLQLNNIMTTYNLEISHDKTKNMAFCGKYQIRSNIILKSKKSKLSRYTPWKHIGGEEV
jgi:beta-xylosidase